MHVKSTLSDWYIHKYSMLVAVPSRGPYHHLSPDQSGLLGCMGQ